MAQKMVQAGKKNVNIIILSKFASEWGADVANSLKIFAGKPVPIIALPDA